MSIKLSSEAIVNIVLAIAFLIAALTFMSALIPDMGSKLINLADNLFTSMWCSVWNCN